MSDKVLHRLRAALKLRGGGLLPLAVAFKEFDTDNSGQLSWEEFCGALRQCGLTPSTQDVRLLFLHCDKDGNNEISYQEFIGALRNDFSNSRAFQRMVSEVFAAIDTDGDGVISMADIGARFQPKMHPLVRAGKISVNEALTRLLDNLSTMSTTGYINLAQFVEFYASISAFEDNVNEFERNLREMWSTGAGAGGSQGGQRSLKSLVEAKKDGASQGDEVVEKLREQLAAHGARGIVGLARKFRIMDDDGSKSLNQAEFRKGLKELKMTSLSEAEIMNLFTRFDRDGSGSLDYEEFLCGVRGVLNDRRRSLVGLAFNVLDTNRDGTIDAEEIVSKYDASKHPDVISGKKSPNEVLREFLETFEVGGEKDGKCTRQEFENYYSNISASIDDDDYFELMIRNAWHISGGEGWCENSANRRVLVTHADGSQSVNEIKNDLGLKADDKQGMMNRLRAQGVNAANISTFDGADNRTGGGGSKPRPSGSSVNQLARSMGGMSLGGGQQAASVSQEESVVASQGPAAPNADGTKVASAPATGNAGVNFLITKMKTQLKAHGAHGFLGLQRKFRIMDDDGNKQISLAEFKKGCKELKLSLSESELRVLFDHFDQDRSNGISFDEFIQGVRDPLTQRRRTLVEMAFARIDLDGNGHVDVGEIAQMYDASKHPEVIAGRKTPDQVFREFLDNFDVGGEKDGKCTRQEFENYYTNLGANIDNEDYFELMIRNAWHLSGGEGWCENSANRRVLVTDASGNQSVVEIKNDLGLKADDKQGMMNRLRAQGVNAANISTFDGADNRTGGSSPKKAMTLRAAGAQSAGSVVPATISLASHAAASKPSVAAIAQMGPRSGARSAAPSTRAAAIESLDVRGQASPGVQMLIRQLKVEMRSRGAVGFIGVQRKFRIMDDDGSKSLSMGEFKKAMTECGMKLSESEIRILFNHFDTNHNGEIDYEEFIQGVRDPLSDRRLKLVNLAFDVLDKEHRGYVLPGDLIETYDASKHPDVIAGRKTPESALREFLDTFDVGGEKDGKVTRQEFENYYTNLSASIDNEDYFELMIRNAWHISGGEGWCENSANRRVLVTHADGSQSVNEIKNDLGLKADDKQGMMNRLRAQGVDASSVFTFGGVDNTDKADGGADASGGRRRYNVSKSASSVQQGVLPGTGGTQYKSKRDSNPPLKRSSSPQRAAPVGVQNIIARLKGELATRGARGFVGLQRKFRIMDDDGNHQLDRAEFTKAMREMNMGLVDADCRMLFDHFDRDGGGTISFEEFIQGVRDPLTDRRKRLIYTAFERLDMDGNGFADAAEIAQLYDASKHPEVLAGRMTTDQVLHEFLDTFDVGGVKDGKVTKQEFENYYANISASIDNEDYFELMIRNAWHISGGEGWCENSANRRVLVTNSDGSQRVVEIKNDLGLKADDKQGMMNRLRAQGVNASNISTFDGADNRTGGSGSRPSTAPATAHSNIFGDGPAATPTMTTRNRSLASSDMFGVFGNSGAEAGTARAVGARSSTAPPKREADFGLRSIINALKIELRARGGKGFIGLQRKFRIMDDDGDKCLSLGEFKKGMQECNIPLRDQELRQLFEHFDANENGSIDFDEFIQGVRDPLSDRRLALVNQVFDMLDDDGSDMLEAEELLVKYDASKHPDVMAGKRSAQDILEEWMHTFEVGGTVDGKVTRQEFVNYYTNLGANIDNEDYFELMIRNAWHLSGGEGWCENSANRRVLVTDASGNQSVVEIKNDLGLKADDKQGMMNRLRAQGVNAANISTFDGADNRTGGGGNKPSRVEHVSASASNVFNTGPSSGPESRIYQTKKQNSAHQANSWTGVGSVGNAEEVHVGRKKVEYAAQKSSVFIGDDSTPATMRPDVVSRSEVSSLLQQLKNQLAVRGARGFVGLQRKFRIIDDDGSKTLSMAEFKKAMRECSLELNDQNLQLLFNYFDVDGNGVIDFEEFVQGLRVSLCTCSCVIVCLVLY